MSEQVPTPQNGAIDYVAVEQSGSSDIRWGGHGVSPPAVRSMRRR